MQQKGILQKWVTPWGALLLLLMLAGVIAFGARFVLGLGGSTNLSDTYPWGLWIVFDLVWIALAAGAYVTAALVYVFGGERYHGLARSAVLMGLISYSLVIVTLLADLGLPWHAWQILVQRPEHSAMFEVSWCVGLYVSVLALEFAPVLLDRLGFEKVRRLWRSLTPLYIVAALSFFVFLMSHSVVWALATLVVFGFLAYALPLAEGGTPILMVIAAVIFSTMHQSSLGSLFLLMPDKLSPLWWSPIMPLYFFLSSIVGGLATILVLTAAVDKAFGRPQQKNVLAGLGAILAGALGLYLVVRLADISIRGQAASAARNGLFLAEVVAGGVVPALLLLLSSIRNRIGLLVPVALLAVFGVILNRLDVVLLGMSPAGPLPGNSPSPYIPTFIEIVLCVSLVAAAVFFFTLAVKLLPVLTQTAHASPCGPAVAKTGPAEQAQA